MGCTCAPACKKALNDATAKWPNRSRASDGCCGDAVHAKRPSNHNPNAQGFATAFDVTHDPASGCDGHIISRDVITDPRVTYVIWNGQVFKKRQPAAGWQKYTGPNPHRHHVHVSIKDESVKDLSPWPWSPATSAGDDLDKRPLLKPGDSGEAVKSLQRRLNAHGHKLTPDGNFGMKTESAVKAVQAVAKLTQDGRVGAQTWAALV